MSEIGQTAAEVTQLGGQGIAVPCNQRAEKNIEQVFQRALSEQDQKSGQILVAAALALEYGFTDIDGKRPRPLTLETA